MPLDIRQERGRLVAQARQIRHIQGPFYFVPSPTAGGYLVTLLEGTDGIATCTCPSYAELQAQGEPGAKCKHLWAVEFVRDALVRADLPAPARADVLGPAKTPPLPRGDLTADEQVRVRLALRFLRTRHGWDALAKALRFSRRTLEHVAYGQMVTASVAVRLARFAGVPVDDVLSGKFPPICPHCGQRMPASAV